MSHHTTKHGIRCWACLAFAVPIVCCGTVTSAEGHHHRKVNLGIYQSEDEDGRGYVRVIPLWTYRYDRTTDQRKTFLWPLLTSFGKRRESDGRHTKQFICWPLITACYWGQEGDQHWRVFSNILYTRVGAEAERPETLRAFDDFFTRPWLPVLRPIFSNGVEGRQRLTYNGLRLLAMHSSQRGGRGSSSQWALFPLVSVSTRDAYFATEDEKAERRVGGMALLVPILLGGYDHYREESPDARVDSRRYDLLWPLVYARNTTVAPTRGDTKPSTARSSRVQPFCSSNSSDQASRFTFWPLLLRWEHTPEGRYFRPLLFLKLRTGEGRRP